MTVIEPRVCIRRTAARRWRAEQRTVRGRRPLSAWYDDPTVREPTDLQPLRLADHRPRMAEPTVCGVPCGRRHRPVRCLAAGPGSGVRRFAGYRRRASVAGPPGTAGLAGRPPGPGAAVRTAVQLPVVHPAADSAHAAAVDVTAHSSQTASRRCGALWRSDLAARSRPQR
jgi:hypothetical protein